LQSKFFDFFIVLMTMKEPESGFRQKVGHRHWEPAGHRASAEDQATVPGFFLDFAKGWKMVEAVGVELLMPLENL
jgi:hypothetical protein